jgi:Rrf2 family protein
MLYLSHEGTGIVVGRKRIAKEMEIPDPFLGKIAQQLARSNFIEIIQGPKGGLRLVLSPEDLNLLDVIEAIMGKIYLNDCVLRPDSCLRSSTCPVHLVWEAVTEKLRETLRKTSFAALLEEDSSARLCREKLTSGNITNRLI